MPLQRELVARAAPSMIAAMRPPVTGIVQRACSTERTGQGWRAASTADRPGMQSRRRRRRGSAGACRLDVASGRADRAPPGGELISSDTEGTCKGGYPVHSRTPASFTELRARRDATNWLQENGDSDASGPVFASLSISGKQINAARKQIIGSSSLVL